MSVATRPARVSKAATGDIAQQVRIGPHAFISDEPVEVGGNDLGPDPHELLDAALASCTALTLWLYAKRKGWPLDNVDVEVGHEERAGVYRMRRDIRLSGDLSPDARLRLLEIANKCPVHRTLSGTIEIASQIVA